MLQSIHRAKFHVDGFITLVHDCKAAAPASEQILVSATKAAFAGMLDYADAAMLSQPCCSFSKTASPPAMDFEDMLFLYMSFHHQTDGPLSFGRQTPGEDGTSWLGCCVYSVNGRALENKPYGHQIMIQQPNSKQVQHGRNFCAAQTKFETASRRSGRGGRPCKWPGGWSYSKRLPIWAAGGDLRWMLLFYQIDTDKIGKKKRSQALLLRRHAWRITRLSLHA